MFYLTPFRVFEFAAGALLVWIPKIVNRFNGFNNGLAILGLAMIVFALFTVTEESRFPSYNALVPSIGTALLIYAGGETVVGRLFSLRPVVYIGTISYTLYLVHWPLIVFYKAWLVGPLSYTDMAIVIGLTGVISVVVYHFIEQPLRRPRATVASLNSGSFAFACAGAALVLSLPGAILFSGGAKSQASLMDLEVVDVDTEVTKRSVDALNIDLTATWPLDQAAIKAASFQLIYPYRCPVAKEEKDYRDANGNWVCNSDAPRQILTVGNSHERHAYTFLRNLYEGRFSDGRANMEFSSTHSIFVDGNIVPCRAEPDDEGVLTTSVPECSWLFEKIGTPDVVAERYDAIVVGSLRPLDFGDEYMQYVQAAQLSNPELKVVVMGTVVDMEPYRCIDLANKAKSAQGCLNEDVVRYYNHDEEMELRRKWPLLDFFYIDQRELICGDSDYSGCDIAVNDIPIFFDGHHFTALAIPKFVNAAQRSGLNKELGSYLFD